MSAAVYQYGGRFDSATEPVYTRSVGAEAIPNRGNSGELSRSSTHVTHQTSIGGAVFARSLASGGRLANDVIGTVARGDIRSTGSITGDLAAQSVSSHMGCTTLGAGAKNIPRYSDMEIGSGRITGTEYKAGAKEGMALGMYHAGQCAASDGSHKKIHSADGTAVRSGFCRAQALQSRRRHGGLRGKDCEKLPNPPRRRIGFKEEPHMV